MSFSMKVKEELSEVVSSARHCKIAELSAIFAECGKILVDKNGLLHIKLQTESRYVAEKCNRILNRLGYIPSRVWVHTAKKKRTHAVYVLEFQGDESVSKVLELLKLKPIGDGLLLSDKMVTMNTCCRRAFVRGAFMASGSISDPQKSYHYEVCEQHESQAGQLVEMLCSFGVDAKAIIRKKYHVVYVKEGSQVADLLNIMEAHKALMDFENERIVKELRNSVNRQVNCETANLEKTAKTAQKQYDDIVLIKEKVGLHSLSEQLEEIAILRLENPLVSLGELGEMLSPKLGKSGVNHRMKKISEFAESLKED